MWIYTVSYALYILEYPNKSLGENHTAFQATAGQSLAASLILPLAVLKYGKYLWKVVPVIAGVEILCVWFMPTWVDVLPPHSGLMGASSFDTALIALTIPFIPLPLQLLGVLTVMTHHGSTALLVLAAESLVLIRLRLRFLVPLIVSIMIASFHHLPLGMNPLGGVTVRYYAWVKYLTFWAGDWQYILFGAGSGSFMWHSLILDHFEFPSLLDMHNEFLQILFEQGVIGFILACLICVRAINLTKDKPKLMAGVCGCIAFGLGYQPLRWMFSAALVALIFSEALSDRRIPIQTGPGQTLP